MQAEFNKYKTGFRTCYNCHTHENCKWLALGVSEADMSNKCPDIKMKNKPKRITR